MKVTNTKAQGRLRLADHMRACLVDDRVVLLDLDRGRYLALGGPHARIVARAIGADTGDCCGFAESAELIAPLLRAQILTTEPETEQRRPYLLPSPAVSLDLSDDAAGSPVGPLDLFRFLWATAHAALWLRLRTLRSIAASMDARLGRCETESPDHALRLRRAVAVFDRLRPLVFTSRDKCLFDSLALVLFLARHDLRAHWVIGVSARPFRAHSWVQNEGEVLNDLHDDVRRFTPILVV